MRDGSPLTRGQHGVLNRLRDSSEKIRSMERHLAAERRRRDLLILKATQSGLSTRYVGGVAGVSSPAVTYAARRAKEAHGVTTRLVSRSVRPQGANPAGLS